MYILGIIILHLCSRHLMQLGTYVMAECWLQTYWECLSCT